MRLIAVTTCTDRKRFPVPSELDASSLAPDIQSEVARAWRKRIKSAAAVGAADEVYCGRSFQEASSAARTGRADFRIISGGLGLIRADEVIPSYSLSLARYSSEFVGARILNDRFDVTQWWDDIQRGPEPSPLAELIRANREAIAVIGISSSYLPLIEGDLASLHEDDVDRIRLIGMGIEDSCPSILQPYILPYDDRLDGPDSNNRGTRGDFSSRAMRHFIEDLLPSTRVGSIQIHKFAVTRSLSKWRRPKLISRPSKSDDEIIRLIKKNWKAIEGKSSLGLRYLRDVENIACEQGRFRNLFHRAARQVTS